MKLYIVKAMLLLSVAAISCNTKNTGADSKNGSSSQTENLVTTTDMASSESPEPQQLNGQNPNQHQPQPKQQQPKTPVIPVQTANDDWDKKLVKTANLKLEVNNFSSYIKTLPEVIKKNGAYISNEVNNFSDGFTETTVTIKVPVLQFENLINELQAKDTKIVERNIHTEDVTTELVDIKSRLETRKEMRLKYLEFLKQSKNMTEALQVQAEINNIQEEIESAAARIASLGRQAAFSTVLLTFYNGSYAHYNDAPNASFFSRVFASFKSGAKYFGDIVIGLIGIWPLWIFGLGLLILIKKRKTLFKLF